MSQSLCVILHDEEEWEEEEGQKKEGLCGEARVKDRTRGKR